MERGYSNQVEAGGPSPRTKLQGGLLELNNRLAAAVDRQLEQLHRLEGAPLSSDNKAVAQVQRLQPPSVIDLVGEAHELMERLEGMQQQAASLA